MKKSLFENLLEGSSLINERKLGEEEFLTYEKLIEENEDETELTLCLNSKEIHPKFWHSIMKRFLQI